MPPKRLPSYLLAIHIFLLIITLISKFTMEHYTKTLPMYLATAISPR